MLLSVATLSTACAKKVVSAHARDPGSARAPAGPLVAKRFAFQLAVFHLREPPSDPIGAVRHFVQGKPIELVAASAKRADGPTLTVSRRSTDNYAPPDKTALEYFARGLTDTDKKVLADARSVTVLDFSGPGERALATYRLGLELVSDLVTRFGGAAWDEATREIFALEKWRERLEGWQDG